MKFLSKPGYKLFLLSFLILFLELSLIRYVPANIRLAGFYSNLVLMATFTGLGTGLLLPLTKKMILHYYSGLLLTLVIGLSLSHISLSISSSEVIFFDSLVKEDIHLEPWFILPLIYLAVSLIFVPLGNALKKSFAQFPPLNAYSIDILGSIFGIILFTVLAYLYTPAWVWFLIISLASFIVLYSESKSDYKYLHLIAFFCTVAIVFFANQGSVWSPYYKVTVSPAPNGIYHLFTNNIPHQYISQYQHREPFYFTAYENFNNPIYKKVLIIGAGTGADTAVSLGDNSQVELIDAVEIDPAIIDYGKKLNPDKPYSNPKVRLHNGDGREFLQTTDKKYDLIILALTDSLTLLSGTANIRLESFLFTKETFTLAKNHLNNNGLFVLYNYYREPWLIKKIDLMLNDVFGKDNVHVVTPSHPVTGTPATLLAGPKLKDLKDPRKITAQNNSENLPLAEDDWPFLYLKYKTLPGIYFGFLIGVLLITLLFIFSAVWLTGKKPAFDFRLFFFGAAFLLLETKSLATFSLLFGSTWVVNSLVFTAILVFVLIANLISSRFTFPKLYPLYLLLFLSLILNYFVPPAYFFSMDMTLRYILASIFYFSPIMAANIIFSQLFKKTTNSGVSFGSNLLGGVFGAVCEYASLITGYKALIILIIFFYSLSLIRNRQ